VVETGGLENRCTGNGTGGSNPSPSATQFFGENLAVLVHDHSPFRGRRERVGAFYRLRGRVPSHSGWGVKTVLFCQSSRAIPFKSQTTRPFRTVSSQASF
jgi:hypothetical protein